MFKDNKYTKTYYQIVNRGKARILSDDVYVEHHHIIPRCMGGDNTQNNIVTLTAREHFICHLLLPHMPVERKFYYKLIHALQIMSTCKGVGNKQERYQPSSRLYEHLRVRFSEAASHRMQEYWKNLTPEEYEASCAVRKKSANKPEVIAKKTHVGEANGMYGKTHSAEVKSKLSDLASERFVGKTYEQLYGEEKANELKQKRQISQTIAMASRDTSGINNPNAKAVHIKGINFKLASDAADHFKVSRSCITRWIATREDCYLD